MNKFQKSLASAVAAGALLLNGLMPVLGATTIVISGNGSDSYNKADVDLQSTTNVQQSNSADVYNNVDADASTGDNDAEDNTGGEVAIETGDADVNVEVSNVLNSNSAEVDCCPGGDVDVLIDNNGSDSTNKVYLDMNSGSNAANVRVDQANNAQVKNIVDAEAETGDNDADDNTGGDVSIKTGDADTSVKLSTAANTNSAKVGGSGQGSSLSAIISGNGTDTYNKIDLDLESATWFLQSNFADIYNDVDAEAETGDNDAEENTGGEVAITTGDADVDVTVDNMVNFNWAEGDCGCLYEDLLVKIVDNGSDTTNKIEALLANELGVVQGNCTDEYGYALKDCEVDNFVDADADSGDNKVEDSTDGDDNDPSIETGDADATVELENSGNSNVYGSTPDWEFPDFDLDLHFSFDLNDLLDWLMG